MKDIIFRRLDHPGTDRIQCGITPLASPKALADAVSFSGVARNLYPETFRFLRQEKKLV